MTFGLVKKVKQINPGLPGSAISTLTGSQGWVVYRLQVAEKVNHNSEKNSSRWKSPKSAHLERTAAAEMMKCTIVNLPYVTVTVC